MPLDSQSPDDEPPESLPGRPSLVNRLTGAIERQPAIRSLALTGLFLMALVTALYVARAVFIPLTLATMLSFVFRGVVRGLERIRVPATVGAVVVLSTVAAAVVVPVVELAEPATEWAERLPTAFRVAEVRLQQLRKPMEKASAFAERVERITQVTRSKVGEIRVERADLMSVALEAGFEFVAGSIVVVLTLFFLLISGDGLMARLVGFVPDVGSQKRTAAVIRQIEVRMSQYLVTVTLINAALGAAVGVAVDRLGMPNPVLWGVLAGLLHFVPYLGAAVGVGILGLAALVTFPTVGQALAPPGLYLLFTAIEANLVSPLVLGRAFHLSPLIIFVWLVFWGWLWGIAGGIIAVPLLVLIKITCDQSEDLAPISEFLKR